MTRGHLGCALVVVAMLAAGSALAAPERDAVVFRTTVQCTVFFDQAQFEDFNLQWAKIPKGFETFEEAVIDSAGKQPLPAPLEGNVPNMVDGVGFPQGLAEKNLQIWDNITPGPNPPTMMPSGSPIALFVIGPGFLGSNSMKIGEDLFLEDVWASLDLVFTEPNHTGVGFELSRFTGYPEAGWHVTVYDKNDAEIAKVDIPPAGPEPFKLFFGIWCEETIGRINIFDMGGPIPDAIDNIQLWMDQPVSVNPTSWGRVKAGYLDR